MCKLLQNGKTNYLAFYRMMMPPVANSFIYHFEWYVHIQYFFPKVFKLLNNSHLLIKKE